MNWLKKYWKWTAVGFALIAFTALAGSSNEIDQKAQDASINSAVSQESKEIETPNRSEVETERVIKEVESPIQVQSEVKPEIKAEVYEPPKPQVQAKPEAPKCHPSYSGCLIPDASDYDCIGGSGNGPYYTGRVSVIGPDVFDLDRDGDGIGCER